MKQMPPKKTNAPEWLSEIDSSIDSFDYHRDHPEIGLGEYVQSRNLELGSRVIQRKRVYLDQKFWIYCRDVIRGREQKQEHVKLYRLLKEGVESGVLICLASHLILEETRKQGDQETRDLTAEVVQELSTGVAVQSCDFLDHLEVQDFLVTTIQPGDGIRQPDYRAWTYIGIPYGYSRLESDFLDDETNLVIQKVCFDKMVGIPFTTLVKSLDNAPRTELDSSTEFYDRQNQDCERYRDQFDTFDEAFMIEIAGGLDDLKGTIRDCHLSMYQRFMGNDQEQVVGEEADKATQQIANIIYHSFRLENLHLQLPGLRIMAGIHAAIRHKGQKHRKGDIHDQHHARVALPYCNVFLTEKSLAHLLKTKPLEYDALYGCRVEHTDNGAIEAVKELVESSL